MVESAEMGMMFAYGQYSPTSAAGSTDTQSGFKTHPAELPIEKMGWHIRLNPEHFEFINENDKGISLKQSILTSIASANNDKDDEAREDYYYDDLHKDRMGELDLLYAELVNGISPIAGESIYNSQDLANNKYYKEHLQDIRAGKDHYHITWTEAGYIKFATTYWFELSQSNNLKFIKGIYNDERVRNIFTRYWGDIKKNILVGTALGFSDDLKVHATRLCQSILLEVVEDVLFETVISKYSDPRDIGEALNLVTGQMDNNGKYRKAIEIISGLVLDKLEVIINNQTHRNYKFDNYYGIERLQE